MQPEAGEDPVVTTRECADDKLPPLEWALERLIKSQPTLRDQTIDDSVLRCLGFVWSNIRRQVGVGDIVKHGAATRRTMERRFRAALGRSIRESVTFLRLQAAQKLVVKTDLTINEIAQRTGFSSSDWLGKSFRRQFGCTPTQYRDRSRR